MLFITKWYGKIELVQTQCNVLCKFDLSMILHANRSCRSENIFCKILILWISLNLNE